MIENSNVENVKELFSLVNENKIINYDDFFHIITRIEELNYCY